MAAEIVPDEFLLYPFLVLAKLAYEARENGLPAGKELSRVGRIEEALLEALRPHRAIDLGHITGNRVLVAAFAVGQPPPSSLTVKLGWLQKETIVLECKSDPTFSWYLSEMMPSEIEKEISISRMLLQKLVEMGDILERPRPVDFSVIFPTPETREAFLAVVLANGYRIGQPNWTSKGEELFWCEIVKETAIVPTTIAAHCVYLRKTAREHGGEFDGWATTVEN